MPEGKQRNRLVALFVIVGIVAVSGAFLCAVGAPLVLMAVQGAREAGRRRECENALKQIERALQNYRHTHAGASGTPAPENSSTNAIGDKVIHMGDPFVRRHANRYHLFGPNASKEGFTCRESTERAVNIDRSGCDASGKDLERPW